MQDSTKLRVNQFLERTIADRTQGDDVIYSLKFAVSQTLSTLENIINEDFFPSFNVFCFLFTYLLENSTAIYKQDVSQLLNLYLKKYYESESDSTSAKEFEKFLDICVLNIDNFVEKYKTNDAYMESTNFRLQQSIKHTLSNTHLFPKKVKNNRFVNAESDRTKLWKYRKCRYNIINANEPHCTNQFLKYFILQDSSSIYNDQIDFIITNHLDNYSLYLQGELLFYLNFYNHEPKKARLINKYNDHYMFTRMFNYLLYLEEDYVDFDVQTQRESKYASFTTLLKFVCVRCQKEPEFIMDFFNPSYTGATDELMAKSIVKDVFEFVERAVKYLKVIEFNENSKLTYWHDMVLDFVETCFVLCFQLLTYLKDQAALNFGEDVIEDLMHKYFRDVYEFMSTTPSEYVTLLDFYVLDRIINYESCHYEADCKAIVDMRMNFCSYVKKYSIE